MWCPTLLFSWAILTLMFFIEELKKYVIMLFDFDNDYPTFVQGTVYVLLYFCTVYQEHNEVLMS